MQNKTRAEPGGGRCCGDRWFTPPGRRRRRRRRPDASSCPAGRRILCDVTRSERDGDRRPDRPPWRSEQMNIHLTPQEDRRLKDGD
ncbi:unnamed protein product [Merluccius merluccius]